MAHRLETQTPFNNEKQRCNRVGKLWLAAVCTTLCMGAASAQQAGMRFALHPEQIELAMERVQLPTRGVNLKLAAPVTSSSADTRLEIKSVVPIGPRELRLRISCSEQKECLPFFAVAIYPDVLDASSLPATLLGKLGDSAAAGRSVHDAKKVEAAASGASSPVMRSGSPATLDMDSSKVHVQIEVVCMENGAAGDKVRVATRDHRLVYVAEVVNSKLLKGTF